MNEVIDFRFRPVGAQSWTRETTFHYLERMQLDPTPSFEMRPAPSQLERARASERLKNSGSQPRESARAGEL